MRILGIDPGYAILGYGVVDTEGTKLSVVDYGVIETTPDEALPERLNRLYDGMQALIDRFQPGMAVFEVLFFYRNDGARRRRRTWRSNPCGTAGGHTAVRIHADANQTCGDGQRTRGQTRRAADGEDSAVVEERTQAGRCCRCACSGNLPRMHHRPGRRRFPHPLIGNYFVEEQTCTHTLAA